MTMPLGDPFATRPGFGAAAPAQPSDMPFEHTVPGFYSPPAGDGAMPDIPDVFVPGVDIAPVSAVFMPDPDATTRIPYEVVHEAAIRSGLSVDVTPAPQPVIVLPKPVVEPVETTIPAPTYAPPPAPPAPVVELVETPVPAPVAPMAGFDQLSQPAPVPTFGSPAPVYAPPPAPPAPVVGTSETPVAPAPVYVPPPPPAPVELVETTIPTPVYAPPHPPVAGTSETTPQPAVQTQGFIPAAPPAPAAGFDQLNQPTPAPTYVAPAPVYAPPPAPPAPVVEPVEPPVAPAPVVEPAETPVAPAPVVEPAETPVAPAPVVEPVETPVVGTSETPLAPAPVVGTSETPPEPAASFDQLNQPAPAPTYIAPPAPDQVVDLGALPPPVAPTPAPAPAPTPPPPKPSSKPALKTGRVNIFGVLKSEWIKLFTLKSTWWVIGVTFAVTAGFGAMIMFSMRTVATNSQIIAHTGPTQIPAMALSSSTALVTYSFAQIVLAVLAVMVATNEYSSGQIRSTLTAVPGRTSVLVAKAIVVGVVTYVASFVVYYATVLLNWFFIADLGTSSHKLPAGWSITDDRFTMDGLKMIAGLALATMLVALFALAMGMLVRNTALAIVIVVVVLLILSNVLGFAASAWSWAANVLPYLLDQCQTGLFPAMATAINGLSGGTSSVLAPFDFVKSLWVTGLWAVVPLIGAGVALKTRDA